MRPLVWLPDEGGYSIRDVDDEYAGVPSFYKTSRKTFVSTGSPHDECADSFISVYSNSRMCSKELLSSIVQAKSEYCRVNNGGDMEVALQPFLKPLPTGSVVRGKRALLTWLNRLMCGSTDMSVDDLVPGARVLSKEQAICSIEELNSSPGWPYTDLGKNSYPHRRALKESGKLERYVDEYVSSGKQAIWTGCLKSEVLKRVKVEEGRYRFFACCPMHFQVVMLQYCCCFNKLIQLLSANDKFPTYIGVSPYRGGWNSLFSKFRGKSVFSLDETSWDASLHRCLFEAVYEIREELAAKDTPWPDGMRERLVSEVVDTVIVSDTGEVFQKHQGNASGSSNTIIDNSLILLMLYLEAYFRVYPGDTIDDFLQFVTLNVIGDDNICAVSHERSLFKIDDIMKVMREWGVSPRIESETPDIVGAHYVSKDIHERVLRGVTWLVPVPTRKRLLAHYFYSTPGENILLSAIKCNSLMLEVCFDDEVYEMLQVFQHWYHLKLGEMSRWENDDVTVQQFESGIIPRSELIRFHLGLESFPGVEDRSFDCLRVYRRGTQQVCYLYKNEYELASMPRIKKNKSKAKGKPVGQQSKQATAKGTTRTIAPVAISVKYPNTRVAKTTVRNGVTTISHREFVEDVEATVAFSVTGYRINAANANLFRWLSGVAKNYETYHFKSLQFEYTPACSVNNAGVAILAIDYDAADDLPADKVEMMTMKGAGHDVLWKPCKTVLSLPDTHNMGKDRFTLGDSPDYPDSVVYPANVDRRAYDYGYLSVAAVGSALATCGELHVSYVVELRTPQASAPLTSASVSGKIESGGNITKNSPFGDAPTIVGNILKEAAPRVISNFGAAAIRAGRQYLIDTVVRGTGAAPAAIDVTNAAGTPVPGAEVKMVATTSAADATYNQTTTIIAVPPTKEPSFVRLGTTGWTTVTDAELRAAPYSYSWA